MRLKKHIKKNTCAAWGCQNKKGDSKFCHRCHRKDFKEKHPLEYWYDIWRSNSRRRNIPFLISLQEFKKFDEENNFMAKKGKGAGRATIDRKVSHIGYTYDNIQILEHVSNCRKQHIDRKLAQMYSMGQEPTEEEISAFRQELNNFGNPEDIQFYSPPKMEYEDF